MPAAERSNQECFNGFLDMLDEAPIHEMEECDRFPMRRLEEEHIGSARQVTR